MTTSILCEINETTGRVTINRPERRNAMDRSSWQLLADTFQQLSSNRDLRCIILTGAGGKAFGSGNDITEFATLRTNSSEVRAYNDITLKAIHAIENSLHPTIARIEGYCLGGGLEIALACDIRIASPDSTFGLPVKDMGIFLDPALVETLVNAVGRTTALELILEGRKIGADEALRKGLVNRLSPPNGLDSEIEKTVERICSGAPLANRFNRNAIRKVGIAGPATEEDFKLAASYGDTEDYHTAWTSFLQKKKVRFRGC